MAKKRWSELTPPRRITFVAVGAGVGQTADIHSGESSAVSSLLPV